MTACQGSYPKFPGAQDTPDQTRALTGSGCPSASCRAAGKTSCVPTPFPFPFPPVFAGSEIALQPVAVWGRVGRSCGTGKEAGLFLSEGNHCYLRNSPTELCSLRAAFALSFSSPPPPALLPSPPPYTRLASARLGGQGGPSSEVPGAPFGPVRLVQNDNDTQEPASVPGIFPSATAAAGFAKDTGFI